MKLRRHQHSDRIELQMTPMIDIVFQLLVFFIMSFKIVLPEGDFNIRMPAPANTRNPMPTETPTLRVRMAAGDGGQLASLALGERQFSDFGQLRAHIRSLVDDSGGPGTANEQEVEFDCDFDLHFDYVIRGITAVTGYLDESGQRHRLIERIRFTPPKPPQ